MHRRLQILRMADRGNLTITIQFVDEYDLSEEERCRLWQALQALTGVADAYLVTKQPVTVLAETGMKAAQQETLVDNIRRVCKEVVDAEFFEPDASPSHPS